MKLQALSCQHCGAPIEVPIHVQFVTCEFCDARLQVCQEGSVAYTEVMDSIDQKTDRIADDIKKLKAESELARIDRDWSNERESFMVRDQDNIVRKPNKIGTVFGSGFMVIFGIFWTFMAGSMNPMFVMFGLFFIVVAIFGGIAMFMKAERFESAQRRYRQRRQDVLTKIHSDGEPFQFDDRH